MKNRVQTVKTFRRKYHFCRVQQVSREIVLRLCEIREDLVWNTGSSSALNTERTHVGLLSVQFLWFHTPMNHYYRLIDRLTSHNRCYSRQNRQGPNCYPILDDQSHSRLKYRLIHQKSPLNFSYSMSNPETLISDKWNSELSWHETGDSWNEQTKKKWNIHIFCYLKSWYEYRIEMSYLYIWSLTYWLLIRWVYQSNLAWFRSSQMKS